MSYKITIKNDSEDDMNSRVYIIYTELPTVSGRGVVGARQLQWAKTKAINNKGQDVFKFTLDFYGFVGYCDASTSVNMPAKTEVTLDSQLPVTIGSFSNNGSQLYVRENTDDSMAISDTGRDESNSGTFTITTDARISSPSTYVIGVARKSDRDGIAPVAAVECKKAADFIFAPSPVIYVARGDQGNGRVITKPDVASAVEFRGNCKEAVVTENSKGEIKVVYK